MATDMRTYTRRDLEEVAGRVAGAAAGVCLTADAVMPSRELSEAVGRVLAAFDDERGSAAGYSSEQLSGTRSEARV